MSRHEGVSCDACLKGNFRGRRFKCLVCYDYDLCSNCYETGSATTNHSSTHPMQCILTRADYELFYAGEPVLGASSESPQSFACPFCPRLGFTESSLVDHVSSSHSDVTQEVVCPICASMPGGDPNRLTSDFLSHFSQEHRSGQRDLISFLDEPGGPAGRTAAVRRVPHSRGVGGSTRPRRSAHSTSHQSSTSSIVTTLTPSLAAAAAAAASAARDSIDPIAELLSQLTSVRRSIPSTSSAQVQQQIQMQLERERLEQRAQAMRSASRPAFSSVVANSMSSTLANNSGSGNNGARSSGNITGGGSSSIHFPLYSYVSNRSGTGVNNDTGNTSAAAPGANQGSSTTGQFLLRQLSDDEGPSDGLSESARRKSQFVQELLLSTLWSGQQTEPNDGKDPKLTKVQKDRKFS